MRPYLHPPGSNAFSVLRNSHPRSSTKTAKSLLASALRRPFALLMILLLLPFAVPELYAQQPWPQTPQYTYGQQAQSAPYAGQYAPNPGSSQPANPQPPLYDQPTGSPPQTYGQQPYTGQHEYAADQAYPAPDYDQPQASPQAPAQPFTPEQLQQLVAPIALYPDNLVAQILAAATYPAQVAAADRWLQSQGYTSPDQIAWAADAQANWDPSIKALTAFPQVLAMMDADLRWTTDLGNAYYNQPQDLLQTVQIMRQRAEDAGTLRNSPQETVTYDRDNIELAPANPQIVYVPAYNPWAVYGQPVTPWPGFSLFGALESVGGTLLRFGSGVGMGAFTHTPFGWGLWALDWLAQSIFFNHSAYSSQSTSVSHFGSYRGGNAAYARGGGGYRQLGNENRLQGNTVRGYGAAPDQRYARQSEGYSGVYGQNRGFPAPSRSYSAPQHSLGYAGPQNNYARPAPQTYAYNRQPQTAIPARPQQAYAGYSRPGGYSYGEYGNSAQPYGARPSAGYLRPQQAVRAPTPAFSQRSYPVERSFTANNRNSYGEAYARPEHSGGFHLFGGHNSERSFGGHESYRAPKPPKAPKGGGGGGHHSFGHHR
jgi:hypothetical protein